MSDAPASVSILLLCWNHAAYLEQCLTSLAFQDHLSAPQIVFLDNASIDGSAALAEELFARLGLTATMLQNPAPQGISANFNQLLEHATGELVAVLSTDDWYEPDYLSAIGAAAAANPQAGLFTCSGYYFFEERALREAVPDQAFSSDDVVAALLAGREPFFFVGCCYRRSALLEVGGWDEALPIEDRDLFLRLATRYPVEVLPQRLVNYRRSSGTASANPAFMARGFDAFFAKHRASFGRSWRRRYAQALRGPAAIAIDQRNFVLADELLQRSLRLWPFDPLLWRTLLYRLRAGFS